MPDAERDGNNTVYLVAGTKSWHREAFDGYITRHFPGSWHYAGTPGELEALVGLEPRTIFFLHWSWLVPPEIVRTYECVCFHMTALPYGRGGSPLQNLLLRGHTETTLTAFRMDEGLDTGPIYCQRPLGLEGRAEHIYRRATYLSAQMIGHIIVEQPEPRPQEGEPVLFQRRRPEASRIRAGQHDLASLYDHVRMTDAEGYPLAWLDCAGFRFTFSQAVLTGGRITARVSIEELL
jgi:methionyl-tRNA formyltransferase